MSECECVSECVSELERLSYLFYVYHFTVGNIEMLGMGLKDR